MYAYLHAEPEEWNMQTEIYRMRAREANEMLPRGLLSEGKPARSVVVYEKTQHIAYGVWYVDLDKQLTQKIYGIVHGGRKTAIEHETQKLRLTLVVGGQMSYFILHIIRC